MSTQHRKPRSLARQRLTAIQHRRREEVLAKQREARSSFTDSARQLALAEISQLGGADGEPLPLAAEPADEDMAPSSAARSDRGGRPRQPSLKQLYAGQLMQPEWLIEVPDDLSTSWYCMPRPEGQRCLLVTAGGSTTSRLRNGALLHQFESPLPSGGASSFDQGSASCAAPVGGGGAEGHCVLDAIYHDPTRTYYLVDLLAWKGYSMYDCTSEFRRFWLLGKVAECGDLRAECGDLRAECGDLRARPAAAADGGGGGGGGDGGGGNRCGEVAMGAEEAVGSSGAGGGSGGEAAAAAAAGSISGRPRQQEEGEGGYGFEVIPAYDATPEGLHAAYCGPVPFQQRDGIYLLHKEGQYSPGQSPTALVWKDAYCSRYCVDTDAQGVVPQYQSVTLSYHTDGSVVTSDDPPVALGRMPQQFITSLGPKRLVPGRLLRFTVREGGIVIRDGAVAGADLRFEGVANQRRGRADSISKVLFQHYARTEPITFEQLLVGSGGRGDSSAPGGGLGGGLGGGGEGLGNFEGMDEAIG